MNHQKYKSQHAHVFVESIDKETARLMLGLSAGNRATRRGHVKALARDIKANRWVMNGNSVSFNVHGHLIDGHHRLLAVIEADGVIETLVSVGMPADAYLTTDIGAKRNTGDIFGISKEHASVCTFISRLVHGPLHTTAEIEIVLRSKIGDLATQLNKTVKRVFSSSGVRAAAVIAILSGAEKAFVLGQYQALVTSDFDSMSPASKAFYRQSVSLETCGHEKALDLFARATVVFESGWRQISRIQISNLQGVLEAARNVIRDAINIPLK